MVKTSSKIILSDDYGEKSVSLPNQRVSRTKKNSKRWQEDTIDYFIDNRNNSGSVSRKSSLEMEANWDFYNSFLSEDDLKNTLDPLNVEKKLNKEEHLAFKFYNILDQPLDTLFGEELKRHSEVKAYAINPHIINEKDLQFKEEVKSFLMELTEKDGQLDEETLKERLKDFDEFRKNDLQSAHEKMANNILQTLIHDSRLNTKLVFNQGFKNLQIVSEEIYRVGHIGKEISLTPVNSSNFYVLGKGDSPYIADGYAWIEVNNLSPYKIIEEFSEELTDSEIDDILTTAQGEDFSGKPRVNLVSLDQNDPHSKQPLPLTIDNQFLLIGDTDTDEVDNDGNVRVYRLQWLTLRKLGKLKYYDEFGDEQYKWVDENWLVDISQGEEVEWVWVNELWEATRIKNNIYKRVRPCPVQMRSQINPSIVRPSYIGYVLSNNGIVQQSRIDKLRPYQEMYNVWANKLVKLWTEHIGKAAVIDVARIPSGMSTEEWYLWLKRFNIAFENSFEEGKKGAAKGQLAGMMQQNARTLDLGLAEEINQAIVTLSWIEDRVNKISAVPEARQGASSGSDGLGVTQQSIVQSSHQTELDFAIHDMIKSQVFEIMIEYIKVLWKDEKTKKQYLLDDLTNHILDIDGEILNEAEYGIKITNSSQLYNMYTAIQQLTHAAMQNGTATLSDVAKMYMATSPSQMVSQLDKAEQKRIDQQNEQVKMQQEGAASMQQQQMEFEQIKHRNELEKIDREWQYRLEVERIKAESKSQEHSTDTNQNHIEDIIEIQKEEIATKSAKELQDIKLAHETKLKQMEIQSKEKIERIKTNTKSIIKK